MSRQSQRLKHAIEVQKPTEANDGGGQYVQTWSKVCDAFADIMDPKPYETISAEQAGQRITHTIKMRYMAGTAVTSAMRIKYGSRYFYIKTVINNNEENRWLTITAEEKS